MVEINNEKCVQCEECVRECHRSALSMVGETVVWNKDLCMQCGHCMAICPRDCIILDGDGYDCEEVEDLAFSKRPTTGMVRNLILGRRSVRNFTDTEVSDEELGFILEAGKYSPTGSNIQGNEFVVIKGEKVKELASDTAEAFERLVAAGNYPDERVCNFMKVNAQTYKAKGTDPVYYDSPLVILVFADDDVDGAIAATNMGIMANVQRLGFCFLRIPTHAFRDAEFAAKYGSESGKKCVIALTIGDSEFEYFSSVPRKTPPTKIFE